MSIIECVHFCVSIIAYVHFSGDFHLGFVCVHKYLPDLLKTESSMDTLYSMNLPTKKKNLHKFHEQIQNLPFPLRLWGGLGKGYYPANDPEFSISPEQGPMLGGGIQGL